MVGVNDEVELTRNRIGKIRWKGKIKGKTGFYYGIELLKGVGKHTGTFKGKRYFVCGESKGIFVTKQQILYKLKPITHDKKYPISKPQKLKKSRAHKSCKSSLDLGKYRFKIPRKTGPLQEMSHSSSKSIASDWKPPKFMSEVLSENEYTKPHWLHEKNGRRGKFQSKTKYTKPSKIYLPRSKSQTMIYSPRDWDTFMKGLTDETAQIEETFSDWNEFKHDFDKIVIAQSETEELHEFEQKELSQKKERQLAATEERERRQMSLEKAKAEKERRKKMAKANRLLTALKREEKESKERESLFKQIDFVVWENQRMQEQIQCKKSNQRSNTVIFKPINRGGIVSSPIFKSHKVHHSWSENKDLGLAKPRSQSLGTFRSKKRKKRLRKRDYRIFFNVNIETIHENEPVQLDLSKKKESNLKYLLYDLFETESERDVFEIQTWKKSNGFKIDFAINVLTALHPNDYIKNTFDALLSDELFQDVIKDGFALSECPHVQSWEARYEKIISRKTERNL